MTVDMAARAGAAASPYDVLAARNREYQRLIAELTRTFAIFIRPRSRVGDLGCGTGNTTLAMHQALGERGYWSLTAADASDTMLAIASAKFSARGLGDVIRVVRADLTDPDSFEPGEFDAINVTHVLSCTGQPRQVLTNLARWLTPGGMLIATDIGRAVETSHWVRGLLRWVADDARSEGRGWPAAWARSARWLWQVRHAAAQNRAGQRDQRRGLLPMHTGDEFRAWVEGAGFEVLLQREDLYCDPVTAVALDDLVVARRRR
jgi:ubiquinone/menaquinone biosynthesis C-methylase UbiE